MADKGGDTPSTIDPPVALRQRAAAREASSSSDNDPVTSSGRRSRIPVSNALSSAGPNSRGSARRLVSLQSHAETLAILSGDPSSLSPVNRDSTVLLASSSKVIESGTNQSESRTDATNLECSSPSKTPFHAASKHPPALRSPEMPRERALREPAYSHPLKWQDDYHCPAAGDVLAHTTKPEPSPPSGFSPGARVKHSAYGPIMTVSPAADKVLFHGPSRGPKYSELFGKGYGEPQPRSATARGDYAWRDAEHEQRREQPANRSRQDSVPTYGALMRRKNQLESSYDDPHPVRRVVRPPGTGFTTDDTIAGTKEGVGDEIEEILVSHDSRERVAQAQEAQKAPPSDLLELSGLLPVVAPLSLGQNSPASRTGQTQLSTRGSKAMSKVRGLFRSKDSPPSLPLRSPLRLEKARLEGLSQRLVDLEAMKRDTREAADRAVLAAFEAQDTSLLVQKKIQEVYRMWYK